MAGNRNLKELAAPDLNQQPLCIMFPTLEATTSFELKSGLIDLLPTFHGLTGEDPHKHLKELHVVCTSMKPTGVTEEQIKLRTFLFSLKDSAKDWLYYLPSESITTWNKMKMLFLEKYFPTSRASNIRKEICGVRQHNGEPYTNTGNVLRNYVQAAPIIKLVSSYSSSISMRAFYPLIGA